MFTLEQIRQAHSKVKSGADFPGYIQELVQLGLAGYTFQVTDGATIYKGIHGETLSGSPLYDVKAIAYPADAATLAVDLKAHQLGKSDFFTFCQQAANAGVQQWVIDMKAMTCTYEDKNGQALITEDIPILAA